MPVDVEIGQPEIAEPEAPAEELRDVESDALVSPGRRVVLPPGSPEICLDEAVPAFVELDGMEERRVERRLERAAAEEVVEVGEHARKAYHHRMPSEADQRRWIEANEAARRSDRARDAERSMAELFEETARLSEVVSELHENIERPPDVRPV